jgi:hypothetical protein
MGPPLSFLEVVAVVAVVVSWVVASIVMVGVACGVVVLCGIRRGFIDRWAFLEVVAVVGTR